VTIVVRTLSERIFDVIRERIVEGKLPVMEPVRQDALAAELGVSKIPCARRWPGWSTRDC
jgi:DNA-binding GntR family transcriptional regulator